MSPTQIAVLGALSGFTIYLGLPLGRLRAEMPRLKTFLNGTATGILVFLLWDVLAHAWEPIDTGLGHGEIGTALGNGLVMAAAVGAGLLGLVGLDSYSARRAPGLRARGLGGPGAATAGEVTQRGAAGRLALMIAIGIGLHNFAEGLAIGNSAAQGQLALAILLIIGFGLHNA